MINDYEFDQLIDKTIKEYRGDGSVLVHAIGALVVGRAVGWRAVTLFLSEPTIRKYQNATGVIFKDVMKERGKYAKKSIGLMLVDKFDNFWQVIQGRDKSLTREKRTELIEFSME